jgi:hypothetical protein
MIGNLRRECAPFRLSADGLVKVLDFGLAKFQAAGAGDLRDEVDATDGSTAPRIASSISSRASPAACWLALDSLVRHRRRSRRMFPGVVSG